MKKTAKTSAFRVLTLTLCTVVLLVSSAFTSAIAGDVSDKTLHTYYIDGSADSSASYAAQTTIPDVAGVVTTLKGNDALVIRRVLDVHELSESDPLITVFPLAATVGQADYYTMYIDVVDVYDENNYFTVSVKPYASHENEFDVCYTLAYANNGQVPSAIDRNGVTRHVRAWGTWSYLSFACLRKGSLVNPQDNFISLCYDEVENIVYIQDKLQRNFMVADFDDINMYGANCWSGFKTGEVYCRVRLNDYTASNGSFIVSDYGKVDLSADTFVNDKPPVLNVDLGAYGADAVPEAVVGKQYSIFPAAAYDSYYGEVPVTAKVYVNYYSRSKTEVNAKSTGFTPRVPTDHYIEYTAEGSAEQNAVRVVRVPINNAYTAPDLDFDAFPAEWTLGEPGALPTYTATGGSGEKNVELTITNGSETLSTENGSVRPVKPAPMRFTYRVTDYLGVETTVEKTVTVTRPTRPTFINYPLLPEALIEGVSYSFPKIDAYNFIDAEGSVVPTVISVKNGADTTVVNGAYVPSVTNSKDLVTIVYTATAAGGTATFEKTVPVYRVKEDGKLDMTKYFDTDGSATLTATKNAIEVQGKGPTDLRFINAVGASNFKTTFIAATAGLDRFDIYLTDFADPNNVLKFTYRSKNGAIVFYVNDDEDAAFPVNGSFTQGAVMGMTIDLAKGSVNYDVNSAMTASIKTNLSGIPFSGFANGRTYVRYHLEGSDYTIGLQMLNNQFLSSDKNDFIGPALDVTGDYGGQHTKGEKIELPEVRAIDVLSGDAEVFVTVQLPNGAYLYDEAPRSSVTGPVSLDEFGDYYFELRAKDQNNRSSSFSFVVAVIDDEPPKFSAITELSEAKIGDKVLVRRPTATDNTDGEVPVQVFICYPGGSFTPLGDYDGIMAKSAGTYTVIFIANDSFGNRTTEIRTFEVVKGEQS